ncbi:general secretion pathway protein C [Pseudomonas cuatrocienegasensis]|uniref:General secretion pathway protein C n=1 Tax=Pseudomonas cuatrocienegasensis TaxID=543360 RepID=A0ABY1B3G1_9PSED|nr:MULTISPECIES: type II secretion system protein N [Pseudomonas]OEC33195.1 hypothetical protein A7D25_20310 [Pseudomonas sp. 21C1]SEP84082.1 general secretion pathway protein C [Pseudomonas cuatrocienegasensis]
MPAPRTQRLKNVLPGLISALIVIALIVSLAWQTNDLLRLIRSPLPQPENQIAVTHKQHDPSAIAKLFGTPMQAESYVPPATSLRLTLLGSFVHSDPARSSAILQQDGRPAQRYLVNAELESGVHLVKVDSDHVEVLRNGRRERLNFPQRQLSATAAPATGDTLEQLDQLEADNLETLRERMEALREQMEVSGMPSTDSEPVEVDPANESSPESE